MVEKQNIDYVASVEGNNVIYNSLIKILETYIPSPTRVNDRISLISVMVFLVICPGRSCVTPTRPTNAI